ncbi:MAG TPA: 6-phosphogluconolactonase [Candidatus Dormibacteraeota bacterium]|nr:6-phosphogluconolactonase [Candidatus Dormibacteraeota bacterium]
MRFLKTVSRQPAIDALSQRLIKELGTKKVLWVVSGGSNIAASVAIIRLIPEKLTANLTILLADERYGEPGHHHSNFRQLNDAGFESHQATMLHPLAEGLNLQETVNRYQELVARAFEHANIIIGQLGIGTDGHIAGILPHSPAVEADGLITSYQTIPYSRLTLTFSALRQLDAVYVLAFGENKLTTLHKLEVEDLSLAEQPSQILKQLKEAYIFNDQIGEPL